VDSKLKTQNSKLEVSEDQSSPPFVKSWRSMYMLVVGELALLIALFYFFMKVFE